jgi:hypothetical protein
MDKLIITEWDILTPEIDRNTADRINWKGILGESLSRITADLYRQGLNHREAVDVIKHHLNPKSSQYEEYVRRLEISVCSMYAKKKT